MLNVWLSVNSLVTLLLLLTAAVGDYCVQLNSKHPVSKAVSDNLTHGAIGIIIWTSVVLNEKRRAFLSGSVILEILLCGFISCGIDVDHFITAHSIHLKDATSLPRRPFLHCTTISFGLFIVGLLVAYLGQSVFTERVAWIVLAAFLSHHIRDAARRGLWLWPLGSTPPFGNSLYLILTAVLPLLLSFFIPRLNVVSKPKMYTPIVSTV